MDITWWLNSSNDLPHLLRHAGKYAYGRALNQTEGLIQSNKCFLEPVLFVLGFFCCLFCFVVCLFLITPDRFSNPLNMWPSCCCGSLEGTAEWSEEGPAEVNDKALPPEHLLRFIAK